jgi:hypothetical protein
LAEAPLERHSIPFQKATRRIALVLMAVAVALAAAACGGGGTDNDATPAANASPAATTPGATATPRRAAGPASLCQQSQQPLPSYNVQVTAHWSGKDRVVIDGSAHLPGAGSVNYLICQNGEVSGSLVWAQNPTFKNDKIHAESKFVESQSGPLFDPNAHFTVVLSVLGEQVQMPYFTISVPVEGKPE